MYIKVEVYIPEDFVIKLANALNEKDFLKEGNYDYAFATTEVTGYWRPLEEASPYEGEIGVVSKQKEIKMEFRIKEEDMEEVKRTIKMIHPYETPMINYLKVIGD
ncbi:MAG: divalent cation tolerance protein CutA [Tissierellia bacterium]|nr:divalent cation tolerance protein CutA [Tissierellia bacterium]